MKLQYLVVIAILGTSGYFYYKKKSPPPPPAIAQIDPQKIKNRHEIIRFYERAIMDLEGTIAQRSIVNVRSASATNNDPYQNRTHSNGGNGAAHNAHRKQIEEYKRRIGVMKAEIGEN
ncbi:MAG: hypothetical protein ACOYM3_03395 [Terrimicrobiaceae bacterium]